MDCINVERLDLAREFKAKPRGPHSRELQKVLSLMRWMPNDGKPVIVCTQPYKQWCVGELPAKRGIPVQVHREQTYDSEAEAFWQVFKRRWVLLTGSPLDID